MDWYLDLSFPCVGHAQAEVKTIISLLELEMQRCTLENPTAALSCPFWTSQLSKLKNHGCADYGQGL